MSTPPPDRPDQPTQPLRAPSEPPRVREREREVEHGAGDAFLFELDDRLRSLRTAVVLLGLVALAALALAAYALLREEDERGGGGDGARVSRLDDRVDDLREDVERLQQRGVQSGEVEEALGDKADAEDLAALEETVSQLQQQSGDSAEPAPETVEAIEDLARRLDELEQQVQQQQQQP